MDQKPNGVLVEHDGMVYRVSNDTLHPLISWNAVLSWGQFILPIESLDDYTVSEAKIGFRPGSILKCGKDLYFIDGARRVKLTRKQFNEYGFNEFELIEITEEELGFHKEAE